MNFLVSWPKNPLVISFTKFSTYFDFTGQLIQGVVTAHQHVQGLPKSIQTVLVGGLNGGVFLVPLRENLQVVF